MSISITIETDNAAFEGVAGPLEVARILRDIGVEIKGGRTGSWKVRDVNGNTVGQVVAALPEPEDDSEDDDEEIVDEENDNADDPDGDDGDADEPEGHHAEYDA